MITKRKAVFLDRDGTIIVDKFETHKIEDLEFVKGIESLKELQDVGYLLIVVTNQSGIGKGHYSIEEMNKFNNHMINELNKLGIEINEIYFCPHTVKDNCNCMKPRDGMIKKAESEFNIDLKQSYLIGDQNSDIKAGIKAGLKQCYIVTTGLYPQNMSGKYEIESEIKNNTLVYDELQAIVQDILNRN